MAFAELREKLSRRSLRGQASKASLQTQSTRTTAATNSTTASATEPGYFGNLRAKESFCSSRKSLWHVGTGHSRGRSEATDTTVTPGRKLSAPATWLNRRTRNVSDTVVVTRPNTPALPAEAAGETTRGIAPDTAVTREVDLEDKRQTDAKKKVYPHSEGRFTEEASPRSEPQENHSYVKEKKKKHSHWKGKIATLVMLLEVRHWFHKEEHKVAKAEKKVEKKLTSAGGKVADRIRELNGAGEVPKRKPVAGKVLDRVRELEQQNTLASASGPKIVPRKPLPGPTKQGSDGQSDVPFVFPLHVNRFKRRTSAASARPETPLYRSTPDDEPLIHAPRATRNIPILDRQPHTPLSRERPTGATNRKPSDVTPHPDPSAARSVYSPRHPKTLMTSPTQQPRQSTRQILSPVAFLHGTKDRCVRHGRRPAPIDHAERKVTKDMVEKSRTGAYLPTGLNARRQMEATSPWVVADVKPRLIGCQGSRSDACPDCVAELGIKRREVMRTQMQYEGARVRGSPQEAPRQTTHRVPRGMDFTDGSHTLSPVTRQAAPVPSTHRQRHDNNSTNTTDDALVVTQDLADGLDAVIFEHGGELERVVLSRKIAKPTVEAMQRLSRDLLSVSHTLAFNGISNQPSVSVTNTARERAVILDFSPTAGRERRRHDVPELLGLIDSAVVDMRSHDNHERTNDTHLLPAGSKLAKKASKQSLLESDEQAAFLAEDLPSPDEKVVPQHRFHDERKMQRPADASAQDVGNPGPVARTLDRTRARAPKNAAAREDSSVPAITKTQPSDSPAAAPIPKHTTPVIPSPTAPLHSGHPTNPTATPNNPTSTPAVPATTTPATTAQTPSQPTTTKPFMCTSISDLLHPFTTPILNTLDPLKHAAQAAVKPSELALPPIATNPTPYHHAPATPRDLYVARWADKQVQETQRLVREAVKGAG